MAGPAPAAEDALAALAARLGLDAGADQDALQALLDDEVELLDAGARKALGARLAERPDVASICPTCGNAVLLRFRGPRCRSCGGRHKGEPRVARGLAGDDADARASVQEPKAAAAPAPLALAPGRRLGRKVELGADNEDWLLRAERIRQAAEEAERARKAAEEAERKRKAEEEARKKAAEEEARKRAAEEEARKKAAEEAERKRRAEEEARKKAAEEAERKRKVEEEAARKRAAEEAARKAKEEEERRRKEEEERIRLEAEASERRAKEDEERRAKEARRPSLGAVRGARAGQVVRVDDMPVPATVGLQSVVWLSPDGQGRLHIPKGANELVNGNERDGVVNLTLGDLVSIGEELFVYDELAELENVQAPSIHFARNDTKPGGPWAYWNEEVKVGASTKCAVQVVDDGVDDEHARIYTKFGRVVIEDCSRSREAGVFVGGKKVPWALLQEGALVRLGKEGPELKVAAGAADIKPKAAKAASMKPSRNVRTVLDVKDKRGGLFRRIVLFSRREVRFGNVGRSREGKMLNELIVVPAPGEEAAVDEKQGALTLVRDGVELRRDGKCTIEIDDAELPKGKGILLQRGFTMLLGEDLIIEGRAYRSPTGVEQQKIPQLGMNGGHPIECVRLDRMNLPHSYVFLVRMLRIGSEATAPLRLPLPGVAEHHAQLLFVDGKFQILAPKAAAKVKVCAPAGAEKYTTEIELEPGVPTNLAIDTDIKLGDATLHFREAQDDDFQPPG